MIFLRLMVRWETLHCNINYKNSQNSNDFLCVLYESIVGSLYIASGIFYECQRMECNIKPGWSERVAELQAKARSAFKAWTESGRATQGPLFEQQKCTNTNTKYTLRFIERNKNSMRSDSLACKFLNKSYNDFWKEVGAMNSCLYL